MHSGATVPIGFVYTRGFIARRKVIPHAMLRTLTRLAPALVLALPSTALGFGSEIPDVGTVAFGRAGAFVTRASDPSAIAHNVAGIVGLPGLQIMVGSNFSSFNHCYQRYGNYDENGAVMVDTTGTVFERSNYNNGTTPYPRVCNRPDIGVTPLVLATWRPTRRWAFGLGIYTPSATGSRQNFLDTEQSAGGIAPSPARNMLFHKDLIVAYPTLAVAWQPTSWLRVGVGIQPTYGRFNFGLVVNGARNQAQSPNTDVLIDLTASGMFLAGSVGVQLLPTPYLSFGAQVHYNGPVVASGQADGTSNLYAPNPNNRLYSSFSIDRMSLQLPWYARVGARFALPRPGRPHQNSLEGDYDPMTDDVFDVEAVFLYERTSMLGATNLNNTGNINVGGATVSAPAEITISSDLSNTLGVRLGGDWNILPGKLAIRGGVSYETGAVSNRLAQIHLPAYEGVSLHAGLSFRWRWLTSSIGYAHVFFRDNDASQGQRVIVTPSPPLTPEMCATNGSGPMACTVNRGLYQAYLNSVSIGFSARF